LLVVSKPGQGLADKLARLIHMRFFL
jgi:hypothetical protein